MRNSLLIIASAVIFAIGVSAQNTAEKTSRQEINDIMRKSLNIKPTKEAKKQAKELKKQGWTVPTGEKSIERQISDCHVIDTELMIDENGATTTRFIQQTGTSTAGTFNAAYAAARANAHIGIAGMLETQITAAMQSYIDVEQYNTSDATTVEKFNQRAKTIVNESLTNTIPILTIYRVLPDNSFEVQVRIAFDKKEFVGIVDTTLKSSIQ